MGSKLKELYHTCVHRIYLILCIFSEHGVWNVYLIETWHPPLITRREFVNKESDGAARTRHVRYIYAYTECKRKYQYPTSFMHFPKCAVSRPQSGKPFSCFSLKNYEYVAPFRFISSDSWPMGYHLFMLQQRSESARMKNVQKKCTGKLVSPYDGSISPANSRLAG